MAETRILSTERLYERSSKYISSAIWAIHPETLMIIREIISSRVAGERLTKEEIKQRIGAKDPQPLDEAAAADPIAVISVSGAIVPHADMFSDVSGAASIESLQEQLRDAVASEDVKAIVLNIDSPGGDVSLVPEFGAEIRAARSKKPIVAVANTFAASAAYWIASQASELVVSPSGKVGSIGVYTTHEDVSAMMEKAGVETTMVSAGKYKVEKSPLGPLSDDARAHMQEQVDAYYNMFVDAVAKGRGVSANAVRNGFGEGRMVMAADAVENGMADRVATLDQTIERLRSEVETPASGKRYAEPRKDNLVRATSPDLIEVKEADGRPPILTGYAAIFDSWVEIDSVVEGRFMERFARGSFAKTIRENGHRMRVLFNHGRDPQIGGKVLGPITLLEEDAKGLRYEAELFDTDYNRELIPGLRAGVYGSSIQFSLLVADRDHRPARSAHNPRGIPERTNREVRCFELGPVVFEAYPDTTASVRNLTRSMTDDFTFGRYATGADAHAGRAIELPAHQVEEPSHPLELEGLGAAVSEASSDLAPAGRDTPEPQHEEPQHQEPEHSETSRATPEPETTSATEETTMANNFKTVEDIDARLSEIDSLQNEMSTEAGVRAFDAETQGRWDELIDEKRSLKRDKDAYVERQNYMRSQAREEKNIEYGAGSNTAVAARSKAPDNPFDMNEYHTRANSTEHMNRLLGEGAKRAIEGFDYPNPDVNREDASENVERLLRQDGADREIAQRLLVHGSPLYRSAFWKTLTRQPLTPAEQQKLHEGQMIEARAVTTSVTGGVTVPVQIDPTILLSSNGAINPFRQIARIVQTTSHQWQGVTSTGVTAQYRAEAATMTDNSPTLVSPTITPERCDAFVPFSWEAAADWGSLETDMGRLFSDSKDILEATKFAVGAGHGSNEPQGVLTGAGTVVGTSATVSIGTADVYALQDALPPRFQANASWVAHQSVFSRIRQAAGGANTGFWAESLQRGVPAELIGYPVYKASTVGTAGGAATPVASVKWGIIGDFNYFAIVDRIGFQVRYIDNLFAGNTAGGISYPNGMSGLVTYWRNSSGVLASNAFRTGTVT